MRTHTLRTPSQDDCDPLGLVALTSSLHGRRYVMIATDQSLFAFGSDGK